MFLHGSAEAIGYIIRAATATQLPAEPTPYFHGGLANTSCSVGGGTLPTQGVVVIVGELRCPTHDDE